MDVDERIRRRRTRDGTDDLVVEYEPLNPAAHLDEPVDRGPLLERLLDHLEPVFDGRLPADALVHGPSGSGKSAVVRALFDGLCRTLPGTPVHTTTRVSPSDVPVFVSVDCRAVASAFDLYRALLEGLASDPVPEQGVGTDLLVDRLSDRLGALDAGAVVALDHADSDGTDPHPALDRLDQFDESLARLAVAREGGGALAAGFEPGNAIRVDAYGEQVLVDVLMQRASRGLAGQALDHRTARRIASWADGDAGRALAALFGVVESARSAGRTRLTDEDVAAGTGSVPTPCVATGRVVALSENRQAVLRELVDLGEDERRSVTAAAEAVAAAPGVDLSAGTVERFLYELADRGIVERVPDGAGNGQGRPPSRVEPRFATVVFRRLYDLRGRA